MIQAAFDYDNADRIIGFKLTGHADSSPYGSDIVCSAVSALSISTVNGLAAVASIKPVVVAKQAEASGCLRSMTIFKIGLVKHYCKVFKMDF